MSKVLLGTYYLQSEQLAALETLGYAEYKQFYKDFFSDFLMETYCTGNISAS